MEISDKKRSCPSCGYEPFNDSFCPNCGERKLTLKDYQAKTLVSDFLGNLFDVDGKLWTTVKLLFGNPRKYIQRYLNGSRKKVVSPIKLFLIANAIYFLFPTFDTFKTTLNTQLTALPYSGFTNGFINNFIERSGLEFVQFEQKFDELTTVLSKALLIILPLLFASITWLLNLKERKNQPFIFHVNYSLVLNFFFVFVYISLIPALFILAIALTGNRNILSIFTDSSVTYLLFILLNITGFFLYRNFFKGTLASRLGKGLILNFMFLNILQTYRFILLMITLGWMKVF